MCQAQIFLQSSKGEEVIMEDVIHMRVAGETVWLSRFFEDPLCVHATLDEIDFFKHKVTLRSLDEKKARE